MLHIWLRRVRPCGVAPDELLKWLVMAPHTASAAVGRCPKTAGTADIIPGGPIHQIISHSPSRLSTNSNPATHDRRRRRRPRGAPALLFSAPDYHLAPSPCKYAAFFAPSLLSPIFFWLHQSIPLLPLASDRFLILKPVVPYRWFSGSGAGDIRELHPPRRCRPPGCSHRAGFSPPSLSRTDRSSRMCSRALQYILIDPLLLGSFY